MLHEGVQTEPKSNTPVSPIHHQRVPAPKGVQLTAAAIIIGQKTNKNDPFHGDF
jgi:hypothetical protein